MLKIKPWFMGRWNQSPSDTNRGSTTLIMGAMMLVIITIICIAVISFRYLYSVKRAGEVAVVAAGLAALRSDATDNIAYGEYQLSKPAAIATFEAALQENLMLDSSFRPAGNTYLTTPVTIEEITVYNPEDITPDLVCSCGTPITETAIHVIISYKVRIPGLSGLLGTESQIRIHKDIDNHYSINIT